MTKIQEIWKPIEGFNGRYEISNTGKVLSNYSGKKKILKQAISKDGNYWVVSLWQNQVGKTIKVHRLIATAFIPNELNKPFVNHKDGNKLNNELSNLEWVTSSENNQHAFDNGLKKRGQDLGYSKFTNSDILFIFNCGLSYLELAIMYNTKVSTISSIKNGWNWNHVTGSAKRRKSKAKIQ